MATPPNQITNPPQGTAFGQGAAGAPQPGPAAPAPAPQPGPVQPDVQPSLRTVVDKTAEGVINLQDEINNLESRLDVGDFRNERELAYLDDTGLKTYIRDQHDTSVVYTNVSNNFKGWIAGKRENNVMKYASTPEDLKEFTKEGSKLDDFGFVIDGKQLDINRAKITYLTKVGDRTVELPDVYRVRPRYDSMTNKTYVHIENITEYASRPSANMQNVKVEVGKAN